MTVATRTLALLALTIIAGCPRSPRATPTSSPGSSPGSNAVADAGSLASRAVIPIERATLDEVLATPPRTRAQLHLLHLAQLTRAIETRRDSFDDRDFSAVGEGLFAAMEAPSRDDVRMATRLALAVPALASTILDAIGSVGGISGVWDYDNLSSARREACEQIIRSGPASATVWAIRSGFPDNRAAASFGREQLARLAQLNACPVFNELDRPTADRLFAGQPAAPCLASTADPAVYERMPNDTLLELVDQADDSAARALRDRFSAAQSAPPTANTPTVQHFGRLMRMSAAGRLRSSEARSVATQALTSANNVRPWVDWLVANPDAVGADTRDFARMLVESAAAGHPTPEQRAALASFTGPSTGALAPITRQWHLPDETSATFEAAWRLAADLREFDRIGGFYLALYRRSADLGAAAANARLAIAHRNEGSIVQHIERCERAVSAELPRGEESASWVEHALADAVAKECAPAVTYASRLSSARVRTAIQTSVARGPLAWKLAVVRELRREGRAQHLDASVTQSVLAHPRGRVRLLLLEPSLWAQLPADQRTEDAVIEAVARSHAMTLLGAWPDQVSPVPSSIAVIHAFDVNSHETASLPPVRIRLGIMPHNGPLLPPHVARAMD